MVATRRNKNHAAQAKELYEAVCESKDGGATAVPLDGCSLGRAEEFPHSNLPLVVRPGEDGQRGKDYVLRWTTEHRQVLRELTMLAGCLMFRGFDISSAQDFEDLILCIQPDLNSGEYLGTSPRSMITKHVFTASELPSFFPIPQHIEMSFLPGKPITLFFFALQEAKKGGSTPLCDFGKVFEDMDREHPQLADKFRKKGVRYVRNYARPGAMKLDPAQLKDWDEVFQTKDKKRVEELCKRENVQVTWKSDGGLRLTNDLPAVIRHPMTGKEIWHNHSQVFHPGTPHQEYRRIAKHTGQLKFWFWTIVATLLFWVKSLLISDENQSLNTLFGDGTPISLDEMNIVRDLIWRHMLPVPWRNGDVKVIDNHRVSHGRLPFESYPGKRRRTLVAWGCKELLD